MLIKSEIHNLTLNHFRNYKHLEFGPESNTIVIVGPNGVGKTNILEAISLLQPGKGLRDAKLLDMDLRFSESCRPWQVTATIEGHQDKSQIVTGRIDDINHSKRFVEIDGSRISKQNDLSKIINISWIVPQMDQVFISGSTIRRRLLDRIVSNFEPEHSKKLAIYEYHLKERLNILKTRSFDSDWLKLIERNIVRSAVIIATARIQTLDMLQKTMETLDPAFPKAMLSINGFLEQKIHKMPSIQIESEFMEVLMKNRETDALTKRTSVGVHRSDLLVYNKAKGIKAEMCSTGEQKLLLIALFLAEVFAQIKWRSQLPVILLDDIVAHLDEDRRRLLCHIVTAFSAQVWVTGTDAASFRFMLDAELVLVEDNRIKA